MKRDPASKRAPGPVGRTTKLDEGEVDDAKGELEEVAGPGDSMGAFTTPEQSTPFSGAHAPPQALLFLPPLPRPLPPLPFLPPLPRPLGQFF